MATRSWFPWWLALTVGISGACVAILAAVLTPWQEDQKHESLLVRVENKSGRSVTVEHSHIGTREDSAPTAVTVPPETDDCFSFELNEGWTVRVDQHRVAVADESTRPSDSPKTVTVRISVGDRRTEVARPEVTDAAALLPAGCRPHDMPRSGLDLPEPGELALTSLTYFIGALMYGLLFGALPALALVGLVLWVSRRVRFGSRTVKSEPGARLERLRDR